MRYSKEEFDQLKKEFNFYKEGYELEGIEFNDTFENFVNWKEGIKKEYRDNLEHHRWLYSIDN